VGNPSQEIAAEADSLAHKHLLILREGLILAVV